MFDVYCPDHGSRVLLFSRDIEAVLNTCEGIEVHYRCFCGHRGVWLTGRVSEEAEERHFIEAPAGRGASNIQRNFAN